MRRNTRLTQAFLGFTLASILLSFVIFLADRLPAEAQNPDGSIAVLTLSSPNPGELVISWSPANPEPTDYRIRWAQSGQDYVSWNNSNESHRGNEYPAGDATSLTLTGLAEDQEYKVQVRSRYRDYQNQEDPWSPTEPWSGPWSDEESLTVSSTPDPTPEATPESSSEPGPEDTSDTSTAETDDSITGFGIASESIGKITVSWDAPDPQPSDFQVAWALATGDFLSADASNEANRGNEFPAGEDTSLTLTGLTAGDEYKVRMRGRYDDDLNPGQTINGSWTDTLTARVMAEPPAAPTDLAASTVAHDSVTLTWTAPEHDAITGYRVLRGSDAASLSAIAEDTASTSTEYTDNGVSAETSYVYAVVALSPDGDGAQSGTVEVTTPADDGESGESTTKSLGNEELGKLGASIVKSVSTAPATPTGLATAASVGEVVLTWDDPSDATITGYRVMRGLASDSLSELEGNTGSTSTTYTDNTVEDDTTYYYAVQAINSAGTSSQSTAVSATTPAAQVALSQESETPTIGNLSRSSSELTLLPGEEFATRFDTGGDSVVLNKVRLLTSVPQGATIAVSIHSHDSVNGRPGDKLHTLTNPGLDDDIDTAEDFTTSGFGLFLSTDYWVVLDYVSGTGSVKFKAVNYRLIDDGAPEGWHFGNRGNHKNRLGRRQETTDLLQTGIYTEVFDTGSPASGQHSAISNLGLDPTLTFVVEDTAVGTRFVTGSSDSILHFVRMRTAVPPGATVSVSLRENNSSNQPGNVLLELTPKSTLDANFATIEDFLPANGYRLEAATDYWVVLNFDSGEGRAYFSTARDTSMDQGNAPGWSIISESTKNSDASISTGRTYIPQLAVFATEFSSDAVVSNLGHGNVDTEMPAGRYRAGSFTTGDQPHVLDKVRIKTGVPSDGVFSVSIYDDSSGRPDDKLQTLANPTLDQSLSTVEDFTSSALDLSANTTYWVVLHYQSGSSDADYSVGVGRTDYSTQEQNWSIGTDEYSSSNGTSWLRNPLAVSLEMEIHAKLQASIVSAAVTSKPLNGDTYRVGENLELEYTFNVPVTTTGGTAALSLNTHRVNADYVTGSGTKKLAFRHRVANGDQGPNGFDMLGSSNNGGLASTVITTTDGNYVDKTFDKVSSGNQHKVNSALATSCFYWLCANILVAEHSSGGSHGAAFNDSGTLGTLSNRLFSFGTSSYAIQELLVGDDGSLKLTLDRPPAKDLLSRGMLVFEVINSGQHAYFSLNDAAGDGNSLTWAASGLEWDDGDQFRVTLVNSVLMSNVGQTRAEYLTIDATNTKLAQPFATGDHAGGYLLESVRLVPLVSTGVTPQVSVHEDNDGQPGTLVQTLDTRAVDTTMFMAEAFATSDLALAPGTTYWLVVERESGGRGFSIALAATADLNYREEDAWGLDGGGDIGSNLRSFSSGTWSEYKPNDNNRVMKFSLRGAETEADFPPSGQPGIAGTAEQGMVLTTVQGTLMDPNGLTGGKFSVAYSWHRVEDGVETEIAGETSKSYVVTAADVGKRLKARWSITDSLGFEASAYSEETQVVVAPAPYILSSLLQSDDSSATLSGSGPDDALAQSFTTDDVPAKLYGLRMVATTGATPAHKVSIYSDSSGEPGTEVHVLSNPSVLDELTSTLKEFTSPGYQLSAKTTYWVVIERTGTDAVRLRVTHSAAEDSAVIGSWTSGNAILVRNGNSWRTRTAATVRMALRVNAGKPRITGILEPGMTVSADPSTVLTGQIARDPSISYQWVRVDGGNGTDIADATQQQYTVQQADAGKKLKVQYKFTAIGDTIETAESDAMDVASATSYAVSNLGQPAGTVKPLSGVKYAQDFTTGDAAVSLEAVRLAMLTTGSQDVGVSIHSDASGSPGTKLYELTLSGIIDASEQTAEDFTAENVVLESGTTYWVVIEQQSEDVNEALHVASTAYTAEDSGKAANWSIGNSLFTQPDGGQWTRSMGSTPAVVKLAVRLKVNSPPRFANTTETLRVVQGTAANTLLGAITANDYDGDSLTYSVSGADSSDFNSAFSLDATRGGITVKPGATIDFDTKAVYTVTLNVTDGKDPDGNPDTGVDDLVEVVINVSPPDGRGTVTLSTNWPEVGTALTASLDDPDGGVSNLRWQWSKSTSYNCVYVDIDGATKASYTPTEAEKQMYLRAVASYDDAQGTGKTAHGGTLSPVAESYGDIIWEATLIIGEHVTLEYRTERRTDEVQGYGFDARVNGKTIDGDLSPKTLTHDGVKYAIGLLFLFAHEPGGYTLSAYQSDTLVFNLDRALPEELEADLALRLGTDKFDFSNATFFETYRDYSWRNSQLDWAWDPQLREPPVLPVALTRE